MDAVLSLIDLGKRFGAHVAVRGLSLEVPRGSVFGLLGPNGAGKTTTLRAVLDIVPPDSGEIRLFGRPRRAEDARRLGYLPEERGLYPKMTVVDHLVFLGRLYGLSRAEATERALAGTERVGLEAQRGRRIEELSKGMQQRVQLLGTTLHRPDLLILDEPFSGLDPLHQAMFKEIFEEHRNAGGTILVSTHVMEQAEKLCDRVCVLARGRSVLQGEMAAIRRDAGGTTYRARAGASRDDWASIPGVASAVEAKGAVTLALQPDAEPSEVLRVAAARWPVEEFRPVEPDLEGIFIDAVRRAEADDAD